MNGDARQRLVRRLDVAFFAGLLITSGLAALLFFLKFYDGDDQAGKDDATQAVTAVVVPTETPTLSATPSATFTVSPSATFTATPTPTLTLTVTPSSTATLSVTPTASPWPQPHVDPLLLAGAYAGQSVTLSGMAQPGDMIQVFDQGELLGESVAGDDGAWTLTLTEGFTAGSHALAVVALGPDDAISASVPVAFDIQPPPTATPSVTATATATPSNTPTLEPTTTPTLTPSPTREPSATPRPTRTPVPSVTPTQVAMVPSATATARPSATPLPTNTATATATETPPSTATPSPIPSATFTAVFTQTPTVVAELPRPVIESPAPHAIFAPGRVVVNGRALPGSTLEVQNANNGMVLGTVTVAPEGTWQVPIDAQFEGLWTLVAVSADASGRTASSDPLVIRIAPPVQPDTGGVTSDPAQTGRTFTALMALLLAAGGFCTYFAGRLLLMLANEHLKLR